MIGTGLLVLMLSAVAFAQRTFNLYVDPIQGDDILALAQNPTGSSVTGSSRPLQTHPNGQLNIPGHLQHAPNPFRTVTAAVTWVTSLPLNAAGNFLPYTNPDNSLIVDAVIIHCLPGLYGPRSASAPPNDDEFDPASGLPWNGESFPIVLPGRVSIQGTSALDTIFDARDFVRGTGGNLILFDRSSFNDPVGSYDESFVDSITLRGCRYQSSLTGAAIRIAATGHVAPSVTNCFIYGNDVGILIDNPDPSGSDPHRPKIVNNTIAWNQIGIVSSTIASELYVGHARPVILNNLIDPIRYAAAQVPATAPYLAGIGAGTNETPSCFEGIDATDLNAWVVGVNPPLIRNFNGYHDSYRNLGNTWPFGASAPRTANALPSPVRDLASLLGSWGSNRSSLLFIADTLNFALLSPARSDLRLAPMTMSNTGIWSTNPVVNWGISIAGGPIQVGNGSQLLAPPGRPDDDLAEFHAWDWDCEGFGNPREASRRMGLTAHFAEPWAPNGSIDLGADEMGEVIVGGYLDSTRIFSRPHTSIAPNTSALDGSVLYFFNVSTNPTGWTDYVSPQNNFRFDAASFTAPTGRPEWFAQLGPYHNPYSPSASPFGYTDGQHTIGAHTNRYHLTGPFANRPHAPFPPFARHRVCDIGPHLADDIDVPPWTNPREMDYAEHMFDVTWVSPPPTDYDIFQPNCWFNMPSVVGSPKRNDNVQLYIDGTGKRLRAGTLSPPLVLANEELQIAFPKSYLFRNTTHKIYSWLPPPYTYSVLGWGFSSPMGPLPYMPSAPWYGVRVNLELYDPDDALWSSLGSPQNNIQTFLIVEGPPAEQSRSSANVSNPLLFDAATREAALRSTRDALEDLVQRAQR